ncbi:elongation factor EF-2 [Nitzschia inconspicua]|uniref:Elongation factor EF-2 n=1 Tax=Nitzschia inconspicua TaxID=303405 RepID=A0A9K3KYH0_9STRA|nr:elongation factor EF-2 [Nitzschia inconspicua]
MADNNNTTTNDLTNGDDDDLYDEFGNYIGPELDDSSDDDDDDESSTKDHDDDHQAPDDASDVSVDNDDVGTANAMTLAGNDAVTTTTTTTTADPINAIVLHEDKEHYATAEETFGEDVRTAVLDEDAMDLDTPIVAPVVTKSHHVVGVGSSEEQQEDATSTPSIFSFQYSDEYLTGHLLSNETTQTRRGIAVVGHLHHGKTTLIDTLMEPTLDKPYDPLKATQTEDNQYPKYTDILKAERDRQMSLVSTPITLALSDTRGKSYAVTMVDCPGHVQFHDESVAALRLMDGAVLCVDAVEGIMLHTELLLQQIIREGLPLTLVLTKIDRLIVELQLPPKDAYYKLLHTIESVNVLISKFSMGRYPELSPQRNNVAFSSAIHGWFFTLHSWTQVYVEHSPKNDSLGNLSAKQFASKLWGDHWFDPDEKIFKTDPNDIIRRGVERSFVAFCLEPIYKIYSVCLGEPEGTVKTTLKSLGVHLTQEQLRSSTKPLVRMAMSRFMETANCGFVDMVVQHVPSPSVAAKGKIARCYSGPLDAPFVKDMVECKTKGDANNNKLIIHVTKLYSSSDGNSFDAFGRIYSGTCQPGQRVQVLGEGYVPDVDDEDMAVATIEAVSIPRGRTRTQVTLATAGNWVLLSGIDATIAKTATIVGIAGSNEAGNAQEEEENAVHIFNPLKFPNAGGESIMKIALEPLKPAELPKMVEGLRRVSKAYPMAKTRVEESGEHVLFGTGELYMDCMLHDLRHVYADVEVKVADPSVALRETVIETSSLKCVAETANKHNKLTFIAEPLDDGLAEKLEAGKVKLQQWDQRKTGRFFQSQYGWDLLSSRSVWAFGDSPTNGTNILLDDTLPSEVDKSLLNACRSSIVQGFQWASREGPLCEEPVRGTKIKILEATLSDKPIYRGGGQIIPTARRTVHSSLLTATPRLMEPIYRLQIQCPGEIVESIQSVLKRRRGHIVQDRPIPGTLLYSVRGFLPALDSFGFETDLRTFSQGQAMVHSIFDHWAVVPGDPLDKNIILHPLEPSPPHCLARELLLKTRRRKGLSEDVSIDKFFDEAMKAQMAATEAEGMDMTEVMPSPMEEGEEDDD